MTLASDSRPILLNDVLTQAFGEDCARRAHIYLGALAALSPLDEQELVESRIFQAIVARVAEFSAAGADDLAIAVSIIIPVHNHLIYTLLCVLSIFEHPSRYAYEIIIADDASTDATSETFLQFGGAIKLLAQTSNIGFLRNCNAAAQITKGDILVFLNNDTLVLDGWLDHLIEPFETIANIGLVGSKLLHADGRLQEAGGILWRDGSGWNFGRNDDPRSPQYNYLKDVDYCSGASIATPRDLWNEVGGFDEYFRPAYAEDADLAFALRDRGFRTVYQPLSALIHHEGVSHGRDLGAGIKASQTSNLVKLTQKWAQEFENFQFANGEEIFLARDRSRHKAHMLIVDHYVPQYDRDAGSRLMYEYCRMFVEAGLHVTFWPDNLLYDKKYVLPLQAIGVEVIYGDAFVGKFEEWFAEHAGHIDYALLSRPHISEKYIDFIRDRSAAKILYLGHDIHFLRMQREHFVHNAGAEQKAEALHWEKIEKSLWQKSDAIFYPGEDEVAVVKAAFPAKVALQLPLYVYDDEQLAAPKFQNSRDAAQNLLFVAGFRHSPNVDGALWFCKHVLPLIRDRAPKARLYLVGSSPPPKISALACKDIIVTGYVPDSVLELCYQTAAVAIAPLRFGGGVKGKIIEAMRYGVPLVTTSIGTQGIGADRRLFGVADTPQQFAEQVLHLLNDRPAAARQVEHARGFVRKNYSRAAFLRGISQVIPEMAALRGGPARLLRPSLEFASF